MTRNEAETRADLIDPALNAAGWNIPPARVRRELIAPGRIISANTPRKKDIADYVLCLHDRKLAVLEAKAESLPHTAGRAQALRYAQKLGARFAFCSNGRQIRCIDLHTAEETDLTNYPSPRQLWEQTFTTPNPWRDAFAKIPFEDKHGQWQPRYYQHNAITHALAAIESGRDRILLTLATGTGKTAIAFQIAWKLFHARWNLADWRAQNCPGARRPRILFLADRNFLADQAFNAFSSFPDDALVRIDPELIRKRGSVPKNGSVFFTIFQTFMTTTDEQGAPQPSFGDYPPDFFDFIIIDECHRGGADDESSWRAILDYFAPAVQLGLTATPKRNDNVDTYAYFGEPVYTYSLKDGIEDGYLTPFKVRQIQTTLDEYVYTPDDDVETGEVEQGRRYREADFNRIIEIRAREAHRVRIFLDQVDQREKALIFCASQEHALAVRDLVNERKHSSDVDYCVRVTANDGAAGESFLRKFQDNEKNLPTVLTTSRKLSTGVDARNIRHIVLMRPIKSMIEFKQIIGRGTRLFDGKHYFTIWDFVKAYEHFNDPQWDGEPVHIASGPDSVDPPPPPPVDPPPPPLVDPPDGPPRPERIRIKLADGKERRIQHMSTTSYWGPDGKPLSAAQFVERLFGDLPALFKDEAELRKLWSQPDTRRALLERLYEKGYSREQLDDLAQLIDAADSDLYDVLAYVAFAAAPLTRLARVEAGRTRLADKYTAQQLEFVDFVLQQYLDEGIDELDPEKLPRLIDLKYHSTAEATTQLGDPAAIRTLFVDFQPSLYDVA